MKRLSDQALILRAIADVRKELSTEMNTIEMAEVLTRLSTLYSLLDVRGIATLVELADVRETHRKKVA